MQVADKLVTPNTTMLVSLDDFKQHIHWDPADNGQDTVMTAYIKAATEYAQLFTGRQFLNATWQLLFDTFQSRIKLTKSPVSAVSSVQYYDTNNDIQTLSTDEYQVVDGGAHDFHSIEFDGNIPSTYDRRQAVIVQYVAGYGANPSDVPEAIRVAVRIQAANFFANRESEVTGTSAATQLMNGVQFLLFPYKTFYHNAI
jgi:uncharacterized phiE125 gp8 family phage protein